MSRNKNQGQSSEQFIQSQGYTYFAFISYKHKDSKWAEWLKHKLQTYRLPTKTMERYSDLPSRLCPVFLDKHHMTPGNLKERECAEVQSAKYLIVICSRNACRDSANIDDEIQFFLDGGGDISRIIPFIVDDTERPETECFPARLQELCIGDVNIIGANIHDSGKNNAVLKVVAYMHGIKLEELESEEKRRKKKERFIKAIVAAVLLIAVCFTGVKLWDYYVPKRSYYLDYTEVKGLPQGIGKLTKKQTQSLHEFYTFVSQYGKVQELRHENSYGMLIGSNNNLFSGRSIRVVYSYTQSGVLKELVNYDAFDHPIDKRTYSGENMKTLDIKSYTDINSDDYDSGFSLNAHTVSFLNDINGSSRNKKSNVARYLIDYDENGFVSEIRYAGAMMNYVATDADGISGIRYERDEKGRVIRESYLTFSGTGKTATNPKDYEIIGTRTGLASVEYVYNDVNDCVETRFLNAEGKLTPGLDHVCLCKCEFENHNLISETYYDADEIPMYCDKRFASFTREFDEHGNEITLLFFGTDGELTPIEDGYAVLSKKYDDRGNMVGDICYGMDTDGSSALSPVLNNFGYTARKIEYDDRRNMVWIGYFDLDGNLVIQNDGYAVSKSEFDNKGNQTKISYFDTNDELIQSSMGFAVRKSEYDERGNELQSSTYGANNKLILNSYGYATVKCEYDEFNNMVASYFYDTDDNPVLQSDGYASWKAEYNESGNEYKTSFYGIDGEPITAKCGYASSESEFDIWGNELKIRYYGIDGNLTLNIDGFASDEAEFDEHGNQTRMSFFGIDGKPIVSNFGYASWISEYDERGIMIKSSYFDTENRPILVDGYASWEIEIDERGNEIKTKYSGIDGEPVLCEDGFAFCKRVYNKWDKVIKVCFYDIDGQPVICKNGYASWEYEYNEQGYAVAIIERDTKGSIIERITS